MYFAGEAYHPCIYGSIPGALEVSELVVHNILYEFNLINKNKNYD